MEITQQEALNRIDQTKIEDAEQVWGEIKLQLQGLLAQPEHFKWIECLEVIGLDEKHLYLLAKNCFESNWIQKNYQHLIDTLLELRKENVTSVIIQAQKTAECS
jgi:chromosomal replication initiation ATPase DnaA